MQPRMEKYPGRRPAFDKIGGLARAKLEARKCLRRLSGERIERIGRAVKNGNGNQIEDSGPAPPAGHLGQVVGPHQPYELDPGKGEFHGRQCVHCIACAEAAFDVGYTDTGMANDTPMKPPELE